MVILLGRVCPLSQIFLLARKMEQYSVILPAGGAGIQLQILEIIGFLLILSEWILWLLC